MNVLPEHVTDMQPPGVFNVMTSEPSFPPSVGLTEYVCTITLNTVQSISLRWLAVER